MNNDDGIILQMQEDGVWGIKEEPYCTIELQTKEDYEKLEEILEKRIMLEKQIPKKPIYYEETKENYEYHECPNCEDILDASTTSLKYKYCPECGQRLDWEEEE